MTDGVLLGTQVWGPITTDLNRLAQVVQGGRSLAYTMSNLDAQFTAAYPGYLQPNVPFYQQYS